MKWSLTYFPSFKFFSRIILGNETISVRVLSTPVFFYFVIEVSFFFVLSTLSLSHRVMRRKIDSLRESTIFDIHQHALIESRRVSNEQRALHRVIVNWENNRFARQQQAKKKKNPAIACLLCFFLFFPLISKYCWWVGGEER